MAKITIEVSEEELDAMEDLLTAYLTPDEYDAAQRIVLGVWTRMVAAVDETNAKD